MKFSEWQDGKWVVLLSHPVKFTPVCSTELAEFARRNGDFEAIDVKPIALGVDGIHSHLAWLRNLKKKLGVEIPYR